MIEFYVDIEDSDGNKKGGGPLASVQRWQYTARMDRAGSISFDFAANDPQADEVTNRRIARAKALINGTWTEVGAGVIDAIETVPGNDGRVSLTASGMDLIRELSYRTVGNLEIGSGSGSTHSAALTSIKAFAPSGWTFTAATSPDNDYIYARYGGESVLGALVYLAERTQTHFYRGTNRNLVFTSTFSDSGARAIQARGDLAAETCAITSLRRTVDTHDLLTRITPYGSGQGEARLTLAATSRSAPTGYTLDAANNYIEADTPKSTYGLIDFPHIEFKEITPISNTDSDLQAAADMLFDAALEELKRRSTLVDQETYAITVAGCSALLRPMQTIRLVYRDVDQGIDIDDDLYILEATWEVDASGVRTTSLVVSTDDRWPASDVSAAAERAVEGRVFQAHPQLNANSYVTAYTKNVDENEIAEFRFRFGDEVVNLQQVLFEFQILPFESTVKSVGGDSSGSGDIPTSAPNSNTTGSGGNNSTGSGGSTSTSSETPTVSSSTPSIGSETPTIGNSTPSVGSSTSSVGSALPAVGSKSLVIGTADPAIGDALPDIGNASISTTGLQTLGTGSASPTIGSSSPSTGSATPGIGSQTQSIGGTSLSTSDADLETGDPEGGDTDGSGFHQHAINVIAGAGSLGEVSLHESGGLYFLANPFVTGSEPVFVTPSGQHTHAIDGHTHTISSHSHTISSHTHTISSHTHTISAHTHTTDSHAHTIALHSHTVTPHTHTIALHDHTIGTHNHTLAAHTHTIDSHTHTIAAHTHTLSAHTHTLSAHSHTVSAHTHTITAHTHTLSAHTHSLSEHTHSLNNHTHDLSESITAIYGIFREETGNTYVLADLDYRVNGGDWLNCDDDAVDVSNGWYQIDITSLVQDSTTFRPTQTNNLLEIRSLTADKTATIDAQLSVRNTIQAIAYT